MFQNSKSAHGSSNKKWKHRNAYELTVQLFDDMKSNFSYIVYCLRLDFDTLTYPPLEVIFL